MLAVTFNKYGPPSVLSLNEVATPTPGPNDVLVRIHATVATPSDIAFRTGTPLVARLFSGLLRPRMPILGDSFAGVVAGVGADVTAFAAGDRVCGAMTGTYAQLVVVAADAAIARIPEGVSFGEAAGLCDGGLTALPFLRDTGHLSAGQHVLVNGASGSVGSFAVQIARIMGAVVTGVTSTRNLELVRTLGADRVIDYTTTEFSDERAAYDIIFDTVGKSSFRRAEAALKPAGLYLVPTASPSLAMLRKSGRRARFSATGLRPPADKRKDLVQLLDWAAAGTLRTVVSETFDLAEIGAAHARVETGRKVGSIVVNVP